MKQLNPKISIVFTSYNHANFLRRALDSLLSQKFSDYELIIVDDCSTDGSQEILKEYSKRDNRIKLYLSDSNSGSYVISTNKGASYARGEYVIFAQCDDFAEPQQLERLIKVLEENPDISVAFSSSRMIDEKDNILDLDYNNRSTKFKKLCSSDTKITSQRMQSFLSESCVIPNLSAALIRRNKFLELNGFSDRYKVLADWDFWLRMSIKENFYYIREPLNNFRQHNHTIRKTIKLKTQICELFNMFDSFVCLNNLNEVEKNTIEENICKIWIGYIWNNFSTGMLSLFPLMNKSKELNPKFPLILLRTGFKLIKSKIRNH